MAVSELKSSWASNGASCVAVRTGSPPGVETGRPARPATAGHGGDDFPATVAPEGLPTLGSPRNGEAVPSRFPGYEVLEELGRGGMGVVFKARQVGLNRLVALKVIREGEVSDEERGRFRVE